MSDDAFISAIELGKRIASGATTSVAATRAALDRIAKLDAKLHSFETVDGDNALKAAEALDQELAAGKSRGPLHGVPIGLKDLIDVSGTVAAAGMPIRRENPKAEKDATVAARLRAAGCVILGKLQLTEGAYADHGPGVAVPVNPWDANAWAGASSSGSGVATAAGLVYASLGSDTLGSIRLPSTMNGVTGLKPTWGRVSRAGVFPLSDSLDHLGPMVRCVEDAAAVLSVIAGADSDDPTAVQLAVPDYVGELSKGAKGLRIGVDRALLSKVCEPAVSKMVFDAADVLAKAGAEIVEVQLPPLEAAAGAGFAICAVECALAHEKTYPSRKAEYGASLAGLIESGRALDAFSLARAELGRLAFRGQIDALFTANKLDGFLIPAIPKASISLEELKEIVADPAKTGALIIFTAPIDVSGSPSLTLPGGFSEGGVPMGFQIVGKNFGEAEILRAGYGFQSLTDYHKKRPAI